jgi:phosphonate transport system substrate-binding protein
LRRKWVLFMVFVLGAVFARPELAYADHAEVANADKPIQFGLTAVVVRENLRFLDQWSQYLSTKVGHPVEFVRRKSYREVMDLLDSGQIDFAWICGYPFVKKRDPEFIQLMSVPVYAGKPLYHSFIIVHKDSPYQTIEDLKDKVFAFSDPESNSGYLFPQFLLANQGATPESHFRQTFFTYNHAETVEAVAEQFANGGAVDSYIWEYLNDRRPELAGKTRVIHKSQAFGFPPLVARIGSEPKMVQKMKEVLLGMSKDPEGRKFLKGLKLDSFGDSRPKLFDSIRDMVSKTRWALTGINTPAKKKNEIAVGQE